MRSYHVILTSSGGLGFRSGRCLLSVSLLIPSSPVTVGSVKGEEKKTICRNKSLFRVGEPRNLPSNSTTGCIIIELKFSARRLARRLAYLVKKNRNLAEQTNHSLSFPNWSQTLPRKNITLTSSSHAIAHNFSTVFNYYFKLETKSQFMSTITSIIEIKSLHSQLNKISTSFSKFQSKSTHFSKLAHVFLICMSKVSIDSLDWLPVSCIFVDSVGSYLGSLD